MSYATEYVQPLIASAVRSAFITIAEYAPIDTEPPLIEVGAIAVALAPLTYTS